MEEANGRQLGLDSGGCLASLLEAVHIGENMLGCNIGQPLQAVLLCQKAAKAFHRLIVPLPGFEATLPVVAAEFFQLNQALRLSGGDRKSIAALPRWGKPLFFIFSIHSNRYSCQRLIKYIMYIDFLQINFYIQ